MTGPDVASMSSLSSASSGSERRFYTFTENSGGDSAHDLSPTWKDPSPSDVGPDVIDHTRIPEPRKSRPPKEQVTHYDFNALVMTKTGDSTPFSPAQISPLSWSAGPSRKYLPEPE
jgi:hypothetical protein